MAEKKRGCFGTLIRLGVIGFVGVMLLAMFARNGQPPRPQQEEAGTSAATLSDGKDDLTTEQLANQMLSSQPKIPGLLAADVHLNLTNRGFVLKSRMGQTLCEWLCGKEMPWGRLDVDCFGSDPNSLHKVVAMVSAPEGWADEQRKAAEDLFPFIATLPYEGAEPEAASAWVKENIGQNTSKVFGPCKIELAKTIGYVMEITAAEK